MRKILLIIPMLACVCACEKKIILDDGDEKVLIINSMLSTGDTSHVAWVSFGTLSRVTPVGDASLECHVNGQLVGTATLKPQDRKWQALYFKARIQPLDQVRLVVTTREGHRAEATAAAPQAAVISSVSFDTVAVKLPGEKGAGKRLHMQVAVKDIPGKDNYYMIRALDQSDVTMLSASDYNPDPRVGEVVANYTGERTLINYLEPLLYNGVSLSKEEKLDEHNYFANNLNLFTDETFTDREYVLNMLTPFGYYARPKSAYGGDRFLARSEMIVRLSTMDQDAFNYLNAVQFERSEASGTYLINQYPFPSNVEGGIGFVTIFTDTCWSCKLPDMEISF